MSCVNDTKPNLASPENSEINISCCTESQLLPSKEKVQKFKVKKIIDKKKEKNKVFYLIWWAHQLKKNASWEPRTELMKDIPKLIKDYETTLK